MAIKKLIITKVILFVLLLSGACAQEMRNTTDCVGREVTVTSEVSKVVSIYPDATRILVSLGAVDKIVGVDSYSNRCPILKNVYPPLDQVTDIGTHETDEILNDPNWKQLRAVKEEKVYKIFSGMVGYDPALLQL